MRPIRRRHTPRRVDRLTVLSVVIAVTSLLIVARLFDLQILRHGFYLALAEDQHQITEQLVPKRGEIVVTDGEGDEPFAIATNRNLSLVYAIPQRITEAKATAEMLAPLLAVPVEELMTRLDKPNDLFEPLKHQVDDATVKTIADLKLEGIAFSDESERYYPEGSAFSHILGFVGYDGDKRIGQYGLEGYFENELKGTVGVLKTERDAAGRWITIGDSTIEPAIDGATITLTVDRAIQSFACGRLAAAVEKHGADAGSLVILNPKTGAILAMCNAPTFDPNHYQDVASIDVFSNRSIFTDYEPGSVFKPITMAAALDRGNVTPSTTYVDPGQEVIDKYTIRNADEKTYGEQTMTGVLENSINTGAIFAARQVGHDGFQTTVKDFGFGRATGVELDSEVPGNISSLEKDQDIYLATASFGQGITVTPIQLATAYAAIANGGKLMKPYIVARVTQADGQSTVTEPTVVGQPISAATSTTLSAMLVRVVENGHGKRAGVSGYYIAGKTGTAQIPRTDGPGYDPNKTIGTFAGFGPVEDPSFVMVTKIDVPRDVQFAESSAAPLFGEIADFLLRYQNIRPTRTAAGN